MFLIKKMLFVGRNLNDKVIKMHFMMIENINGSRYEYIKFIHIAYTFFSSFY